MLGRKATGLTHDAMAAELPEPNRTRGGFLVKKFLVTSVTAAALLCAMSAPTFADVIHTNGTTGQPSEVGSNAGSVQGQTNRSTTGTTNKFTHDGWKTVMV